MFSYFFSVQIGDGKNRSSTSVDVAAVTTTEAPHFGLHVGNNSIDNVCNITVEDYSKLTAFYPQHCSKDVEPEAPEADG